jgi:2-oxoisovalerate dehydrogenase E1 component alpha subunit
VLKTPTLFLVRNNGFAISTPAREQYGAADGIAARAPGYGVPALRVDGNDALAVLGAVRAARARVVASGRPALVEAMTYRIGHHSTSDDSFAYRSRDEVEARKRRDDPLARLRAFLARRGWWSDADEDALKARARADVLAAFRAAETLPRPPLAEMFGDVYGGPEPWNIVRAPANVACRPC